MQRISNSSSSSSQESKLAKKKVGSSKTPAKVAKGEFSKVKKDFDTAGESLLDFEASACYHHDVDEFKPSTIADNTSDSDDEPKGSTCDEDQTFWQNLGDLNKYLKVKVGADINAKKWLEGCSGLDELEKSEVIIRLVYEVCLAKNTDYDLENDAEGNEKENNKDKNFDTRRIFDIFKKVNCLLFPQDRKRLVEFVCQNGNVKLLEMICKQEEEDKGTRTQIDRQYQWKGKFTGYETLIELLQYVLKQPCSSEIVLCLAKKVYGTHHNICFGKKYLEDSQIQSMEKKLDQPSSVMEECFKKAIELGYADVVLIMLSGDMHNCIRLMKDKRFREEVRFREALDMIEEAVADVISSWVEDGRQYCRDEVKRLLKEGIEVNAKDMSKQDLINELESRGMELSADDKRKKERLVEKLMEKGGKKVRLNESVVGVLIATLFFNYQDELIKLKKPFKQGITKRDESRREKEINDLNIDSRKSVRERVLKSIQALNSSSHVSNNWFFREVLEKIVNDEGGLNKLKAVCAAICKETLEELIEGMEVYEVVMKALEYFEVEPNHIKKSTPKNSHSRVSLVPHFPGDIDNLVKGIRELNDPALMEEEVLTIVKGLAGSKVPAFSGLSRITVIKLKRKRDKTDGENKDLQEKVLRIMDEIRKGIDILADGENRIDTEDIFRHFKIINSEIRQEDRREIVELVCQSGNVKLLEMICKQEMEDKRYRVQTSNQYPWKGDFTGYKTLIELLQYVLQQPCTSEIVLCIAKKVYLTHHNVCFGKQFLGDSQIQSMERRLDQPNSVMEECFKKAVELGYRDVVLVMMGGDMANTIRLMTDSRFQEEKVFREALDMVEEAVADVMSSWVEVEHDRQSFKEEIQRLEIQGRNRHKCKRNK